MLRGKILIVDDEPGVRAMLGVVLRHQGYEVLEAEDGVSALETSIREQPDVVVMDVRMPGMDGLAAFRAMRHEPVSAAVILMTAFATVDKAVEAMKAGVYDYIIKPFNIDEVVILIRRAVENRRLADEAKLLRRELSSQYQAGRILTKSPKMLAVLETMRRVAPTRSTVLVTGESGTGKELMVNHIHYTSPRANQPLIKVNCSALPESLLESELFGHEKGAFTSAACKRIGRFEMADKGTLFLDEIGEMPQSVQVKLLRVLQERQFERVGGSQTLCTDIRVVAATNRSLPEAIAQGTFREDLYYRLAVVTIDLPPLRERPEDIALLARLFLQKVAQETGREIDDFDPESMLLLEKYCWPGNVRELANVVERAVIMSTGRIIFAEDLPDRFAHPQLIGQPEAPDPGSGRSLRELVKQTESAAIRDGLRRNKGNRMKTARDLDMSRRALQYKIDEYGLGAEGEG